MSKIITWLDNLAAKFAYWLATAAVVAVAAGILFTIFKVVVYGNYWATAGLVQTFLLAVLIPLGVLLMTYGLLRLIWAS